MVFGENTGWTVKKIIEYNIMAALSILEDKSYTLFLNSADKISGNNNSATFFIDWEQFLPKNYNEFKVNYSFQTVGGYYKDTAGSACYSTAKVSVNFGSRSFCYETSTRGTTNTLGYIYRNIQTTTSDSNYLSSSYMQLPPKTIGRPGANSVTFTITNMYSGAVLTNTDNTGTATSDMTSWQCVLEFVPISASKIQDEHYSF
jgi:hypothetical protein